MKFWTRRLPGFPNGSRGRFPAAAGRVVRVRGGADWRGNRRSGCAQNGGARYGVGTGLALWTVPGAAGVERDDLMAALNAAVQVTAERSSAAVLDGGKHAEMQPGQPGPVLLHEAVAMRTDDIGHLERWPFHLLCSLRDRFTWSRLDSSALSSGVPAARR